MRTMFLLVSILTACAIVPPAALDTQAAITMSAQAWCETRAACSHVTIDPAQCTASIVASYCNVHDCAASYEAWPQLEACTESMEAAAPQDACRLDQCSL